MSETSSIKIQRKSGNTRQISPAKHWVFTWNNYTEDDFLKTINILNENSSKYIVGKEVGKKKKKPHLQGYVMFNEKIRPKSLISKKIHWKKAKGSAQHNYDYCSKEGNFVCVGLKPKRMPKILKYEQLYKWQKDIVEIAKTEPDDRTIHWFWSEKGCLGKTQLVKYLITHFEAVQLDGKGRDIAYIAAEYESDVYVLILPKNETSVDYCSIEKIKDGVYCNVKFKGKPILRPNPHFFVFANMEPDKEALSEDRWKIIKYDENSS